MSRNIGNTEFILICLMILSYFDSKQCGFRIAAWYADLAADCGFFSTQILPNRTNKKV